MSKKLKRDSKLTKGREIKDPNFTPGDHYFVETAAQKSLFGNSHLAPRHVWGIVDPRATGARKEPPDIKIFPTADSFFDIGHVMALELGGADDQENFVPQFREENQHAAWKKMETALRAHANTAWNASRQYTFMQIEVHYDPAGGLVPTQIEVAVCEIAQADFPADPDDVEKWRLAPPAKRLNATSKRYDNKLTDRDLINTGLSKVQQADNVHWEQYMFGSYLNMIEADPVLTMSEKASVEKEVLFSHFGVLKKGLSKQQQREVELGKAASTRTLVSDAKRKALGEMEDYYAGRRTDPPGSGELWDLQGYRGKHSKGGEEPVRRRESSPAPPLTKRKYDHCRELVEETINKRKKTTHTG